MAGSISVGGISTGLDTSSIISKMIELKRRPIDVISAKKAIYDTKLTELQSLNTKLLNFQNTSKSLKTSDKFQSKTASFSNSDTSSNAEVVKLTTSSTATVGNYSLVVNSLARPEREISVGVASTSSSISTGIFTIAASSTITTITLDSSNNTLTGLRDAINSSSEAVSATILDDGSGTNPYRLVITSNNTGADAAVSISSISDHLGGPPILGFTEIQSASDASITLDGVNISRVSNTITDVIDGLTIELKSAGTGTVTVASDTSNVKTNIETFISEYNDLTNFINDQLYFDAATGETGILFGNTAVLELQNKMRETVSSEIPGLSGTYTSLAQIGITTNSITGNLEIDNGDITDALNNDIDAVINLFISAGSSDTSGLGFVGYTENTTGGTYRVQVSGGQVQTASATATFHNANGSGNYYSGASGTPEYGLNFSLTSLSDGSKGSITFSLGIAANFDRILNNLTDKSQNGPLKSELDTLTDNISDIEDSITNQERRLAFEEDSLTQRFAVLEGLVSRMQSQGNFLAQISSGLVASAKR